MFEILILATAASHTDSVRHTPGRPTELAWGVLHCPMCIVKPKKKSTWQWDQHAKNHGIVQRADASIYLKEGQRDCSVTPNITGCAAMH
mmetsp:Transcript_31209/g.65358  ORF Transcript_31209/g.65358 Transcript_31209/m.65358 type:complete len:89 (-) Transcript_31209:93-359(-)